jgi:HAD superfamily hydrolase (TIGR01458 family)
MKNIPKGILFDLDGVLYTGEHAIEGAADALRRIRDSGMLCRFVTNTSTLSKLSLHRKLLDLGLPVAADEVLSSTQATLRFLRQQREQPCCLLLADEVRRDFEELPQAEIEQAQYIVLGDIGDELTPPLLNRVFNRLLEGGRLIAVHKNRFWQTREGLQMDIGGYVAALEYCSGRPALVMGKPAPDFFQVALCDLGLAAGEVAIVGDDIDADIAGGQAVGLHAILVRTGKYRQTYVEASPVRPDRTIDSIRELPELLGIR